MVLISILNQKEREKADNKPISVTRTINNIIQIVDKTREVLTLINHFLNPSVPTPSNHSKTLDLYKSTAKKRSL